jgi:hypothetical protein
MTGTIKAGAVEEAFRKCETSVKLREFALKLSEFNLEYCDVLNNSERTSLCEVVDKVYKRSKEGVIIMRPVKRGEGI